MRLFMVFIFCLAVHSVYAQISTISNVHPRLDTNGQIIDAHDGRVIKFGDTFYWYGTQYGNTNGFTKANKYVVYSSPDLVTWKFEGDLVKDAPQGVYYRPHVIFNKKTNKYVLWYNWYPKLWDGQFGVATSNSPQGPFKIKYPNVRVSKSEIGVGDLGLFVDEDGTAYVSYNSIQNHQLVVERLNKNYTGSTLEVSSIIAEHVEAGSMFKRKGIYYLLTDYTCCFCNYGSGARVYTAKNPLGPYRFSSNMNRFPGEAVPQLTDGKLMGTKPFQLDVKHELVLAGTKNETIRRITIYTFTGNREGQCGQVNQPRVHPEIAVPDFTFYQGEREILATRVAVDTLGLRNKLTYDFERGVKGDLTLRVADSYPAEKLSLLEIEADSQTSIDVFTRGENTPRSPIIPAQQGYVMELPAKDGIKYIWMGDLWGSASDNIKGHDYQYWSAPLEFNEDGSIRRMQWVDEWSFSRQ